ncbi:MAG: hypothetical protein Q9225_003101 [Loekoesia sp. 1 TL-2023]
MTSTRPSCAIRSLPKELQHRRFSIQPQRPQEHARIDDSFTNEQDVHEHSASFPADNTFQKDDIKLPNDAQTRKQATNAGFYFKRARLYSRDPLGVTTLGKPAEVLRVQDSSPRSSERKWWLMQAEGDQSPSTMEPLTSSDILERVTSERGLISPARARENIEALKQEWLSGLKEPDLAPQESECYDLGKRLHDGFTARQLHRYANEAIGSVSTDLTDLNKPFRSALLVRSEWRAGITPFPSDAAQRLLSLAADPESAEGTPSKNTFTLSSVRRERRRSQYPIKYIMVNQIMRQCWNIKPREELESVGEVDIQIPETYLELITSHERHILRQVTEEYDAKIDFLKIEPILRITANQATCVSTLKLLSMVLDEVACYEMPLGEDGDSDSKTVNHRSLLNDRLLREVEKLSNTVMRWAGSENQLMPSKLLIYYLKNSGRSLEDAKSFIKQSLGPIHSRVTGAFFGGSKPMASKLTSVPVEVGQSLLLTDRGVAWARKSSTSNETINYGQNVIQPPEDYVPSSALKAVGRHVQASSVWRRLKKDDFDRSFWSSTPFQESSAVFGRLLYPAKDVTSKKKPHTLLEELTGHRIFTTEVPSIRRSLELREVKILKIEEELRIRMHAITKINVKGIEIVNLPDLELRFDMRYQEQKVVLKSVRLILEEKQADLLLPHEQVDLRFATQTYIMAKAEPDPRILQFVESSSLDKWGIDQFNTSQVLTIGIPHQILAADHDSQQADDPETLINYSVSSIERRSIGYGRPAQPPGTRQFDLSLSSIRAGPIRGRRQEFRFFDDRALEFIADSMIEKDGKKEEKTSLVNGLYACARTIIEYLRVESRGKVRPVSKKSLKRVRQIMMGFKGTKRGRSAIMRRQSTVVRRRLTDSPLDSDKAEGSAAGRSRRGLLVRKVRSNEVGGE